MVEENIICALLIYMVLRLFVTQGRHERMPYLNVINFGIAGLIALKAHCPLGAIIAMAYFILATVGANAIAFTIDKVREIEEK